MRPVVANHEELYHLAAETLHRGAAFALVARGESMVPFIREGDHLTIAPLGHEPLRKGEVALYQVATGALRVHRVIGRSGDGSLLFRGDARKGLVERVPPDAILGRVVILRRNGRMRRLGRGWRLIGRLWHALWPWSHWIYRVLRRVKQILRGATGRFPWFKEAE